MSRLKTVGIYSLTVILVVVAVVGLCYVVYLNAQPTPEQVLAKELKKVVDEYSAIYWFFNDDDFPIELTPAQHSVLDQHITSKRDTATRSAYGRYYIEVNP